MSEQASQLNEKFATIAGEAVAAIAIHSDGVNDILASRLNAFEETFATRGGALVSTLAGQTGQLSAQLDTFERLIGEGGESVVERIGAYAGRLGSHIDQQVGAVDAVMANHQAEMDRRLAEHNERFAQTSGARLAEFETASLAHHTAVDLALAAHSQRVEHSMGEGLNSFEATIGHRTDEIVARIDAKSTALAAQLDGKLSAIEQTIVTRGPELDDRLAKRNAETAALYETNLRAIDDRASAKIREVASSLEQVPIASTRTWRRAGAISTTRSSNARWRSRRL